MPPAPRATADRLHSAAIHLLRRLRTTDVETGLTAPRASVLSVLVYGGPATLTALARVEQVRPPTMTRLIGQLEREGLVRRTEDSSDRRLRWIHPTPRGRRLLHLGRSRRVGSLQAGIDRLSASQQRRLERALPVLEALANPPSS